MLRFEEHKNALIATKLQKSNCLEEEASKYWAEIEQQRVCFKGNIAVANLVKTMQQADVVAWFKNHVQASSPEARLLTTLIASKSSPKDGEALTASAIDPTTFHASAAKHEDVLSINLTTQQEYASIESTLQVNA